MTTRLDAAIAELVAALRDELREATLAPGPDRMYSISEAAAALGVSRTTAYAELQAGRLRSVKLGRRRLVPASAIAERIGWQP
jgi:excisionase family DNA binding protein